MSIIDHQHGPADDFAGESGVTPATEPIVTHPAWCSPADCTTDSGEGDTGQYCHVYHRSRMATYDSRGFAAQVQIVRFDSLFADEKSEPSALNVFHIAASEACDPSPDDLEDFGRWLIATAAEHRKAIATEGQDSTMATHPAQ